MTTTAEYIEKARAKAEKPCGLCLIPGCSDCPRCKGTGRAVYDPMLRALAEEIDRLRRDHEVTRFVETILHGDDEHVLWLRRAAECWVEGVNPPPVDGMGTKAALRARAEKAEAERDEARGVVRKMRPFVRYDTAEGAEAFWAGITAEIDWL